jgi:hypothetical protein
MNWGWRRPLELGEIKMSYDQWKTASPFDDEPDFVEEAEKWMKRNSDFEHSPDEEKRDLWWMIKGLCHIIEES